MRPRLPRFVAALAALLITQSVAFVARAEIYMLVPGITGEVTQTGFNGWIEVLDLSSDFAHLPPALNAPFSITKLSDSTSPRFYQALVNDTNLGTIQFAERTTSSNGLRTLKIQPARVIRMMQTNDTPGFVDLLTFAFDRYDMIESDTTQAWYDFPAKKGQIIPVNNTAPTIAAIGNQSTNEDVTKSVTANIDDAQTPLSLSLTATSNNSTLLPNSRITITGSGASRTINLAPAANRSGAALITVSVSDGLLTTTTDFIFAVNAVDDPPTVSAISNQTTSANTPLDVAVVVGDVDTSLASITLAGTSSNTTVLANAGITFTGTTASRTMKLTPVAGAFGTTTVTVTANDGNSNSSPRTFTLNVTAPPTAPSAITLTPNSVPENSPAGTVVGTLSATDPNPGDTHTFTLLDSAGGRFGLTGNTITVTGAVNLDYEFATSHVLSVRATDSSGLQFTGPVTVNIAAVNEAPSINATAAPGLSLVRGFTAALPAVTVADPDASSLKVDLSSTVVQFTVVSPVSGVTLTGNGTNALTLSGSVSRVNATLAAGNISLSLASGQPVGPPANVTLNLVVNDLGSSGAGGALSANTSVVARVYRHRIEQWREEHFTPAQLANPALEATLWGNLADPDADGGNNLSEYTFMRDPLVADAQLAPAPVLAPGADSLPRLHLSVPVRRDDPELTVDFVSSADLTTWSGATIEAVSTLPIDGAYELRTVRDTSLVNATTKRFLRGTSKLTLD